MKPIIWKSIYILVPVIITMVSCENVLDIKPTDIISEEAVKNDPLLVDALLNNIYKDMKFQMGDRNGNSYAFSNTERNEAYLGVVGGELNVFAAWQQPFQAAVKIIDENGATDRYWPYKNIRCANELLKILDEATFDAGTIIQKSAEVRWLRAYMYFELVKRYGGVPLITEPQNINQPISELYVLRNSEKEIYDFIGSEMDDLVNILPGSYAADGYGRPTKWAAYALKSRAMLYAGSIAKYAVIQLNGLLGIPSGEAEAYFHKSYDASLEIINKSQHVLYKENPDPVANYGEIFIKDRNPEIIFAEIYDVSLLKVHSWNYVSMPDAFAVQAGSNHRMYLESFEKYEYKDGTSGKLNWSMLDGIKRFDLATLILNKDPRFLATAFYQEIPWQGGKVYFHTKTVGTIPPGSDWPPVARTRDKAGTGFLVRKRVNEAIKLPPIGEDETDWIVFRTGEMYLNAAEAAYEYGSTDEAKRLINIIRERAGMPPKKVLTMEDIRNERFVELFNEEQRYYDLRRWRIAVASLNGKGFHGVDWVYYINENKYTLKLKDGDFGRIRTFSERNYYFPLGLDKLADNPSLVENPGYQ